MKFVEKNCNILIIIDSGESQIDQDVQLIQRQKHKFRLFVILEYLYNFGKYKEVVSCYIPHGFEFISVVLYD